MVALLTALPSDECFANKLPEVMNKRLWPSLNTYFVQNKEEWCLSTDSNYVFSIVPLMVTNNQLLLNQQNHVLEYRIGDLPLMTTQLLANVALSDSEWLVPIFRINEDFEISPMHFLAANERIKYASVAFFKNYASIFTNARQEVTHVLMRFEQSFTQQDVDRVTSSLIMNRINQYIDIESSDFDLYIFEAHSLMRLMRQTLAFLNIPEKWPDALFNISLETYIDSLLEKIPKNHITDWLNHEFFINREGHTKRLLADSYIYMDDQFVIRATETEGLIVYFRFKKDTLLPLRCGSFQYQDQSFLVANDSFLIHAFNETRELLMSKLAYYQLSVPVNELAHYRLKKLLSEDAEDNK